MNGRKLLNKLLKNTDFSLEKMGKDAYSQDGLLTKHNHGFMYDPRFKKAFERGLKADGGGRHHWRVHVALWNAFNVSQLPGDFVECGVNRGFMSSAIMEYLNWNSLNKNYYLLDTFSGIDERYISDREVSSGRLARARKHAKQGDYVMSMEQVENNFSEWERVCIIKGAVPDTLTQVKSEQVAFLHLDMNCAEPEFEAFNYFWEKLVKGGVILLDDYGFRGYEAQKDAMDAAAAKNKTQVLSLPTGQGLVIKY